MTTRNYSSTAASTTLTSGINGSQTTMAVAATTGFPAAPFVLSLDADTVTQELVLVTGVASLTLTVTRGYDSTTAQAHLTAAPVQHCHAAIDFRDNATHAAATTGVHGVAGAFVGTTDTQTITNKTLGNTNTINGFSTSKVMVSDGAGKLAAGTSAAPSGTILGTTDAQTVTNKNLTSGTNTFPATVETTSGSQTKVDTHAAVTATHGATGAVVGTTNTQTLTNKTLTSPTINSPTVDTPTFTGIVAASLGGTLNTTDWDTPSYSGGTIFGPLILLNIVVAKKAASPTITAGAGGNFTDNTVLTGITAGFRPGTVTAVGRWWSSSASGTAVIGTSGNVILVDGYPTSTIAAGDVLSISIMVQRQ